MGRGLRRDAARQLLQLDRLREVRGRHEGEYLDRPVRSRINHDEVLRVRLGRRFGRFVGARGQLDDRVTVFLDRAMVSELGIPSSQVLRVARGALQELGRLVDVLRVDRPQPKVSGQRVILVDDGVATGATMRAAIRGIKRRQPAWLAIAVPVAAPDTVAELRREVDEVVCLHQPRNLRAVGVWYEDFRQVSTEEVVRILQRAAAGSRELSGP